MPSSFFIYFYVFPCAFFLGASLEASRLLQLCSVLNTKTCEKIASHLYLLPRENVKHNCFNIAKQITEVGDVYVKIHQKFVMLRNFIFTKTYKTGTFSVLTWDIAVLLRVTRQFRSVSSKMAAYFWHQCIFSSWNIVSPCQALHFDVTVLSDRILFSFIIPSNSLVLAP